MDMKNYEEENKGGERRERKHKELIWFGLGGLNWQHKALNAYIFNNKICVTMDPLMVICSKINPRQTILEPQVGLTYIINYFACTPSSTTYNEPGLELLNIWGP